MGDVSEPSTSRPRQVTLAGWMLMAGSTLAVLLVADRLAGLHSLETRQAVERFLAQPPGSDLGLEVDGALGLIRTAAMVTAGCATAAGILGYQVLRRSRSARLAVTLLAVPIFLAGLVTGGFVTSVIAASAAILWLQPSRAWFDGTTPPERPAAAVARTAGPAPTMQAFASPTRAGAVGVRRHLGRDRPDRRRPGRERGRAGRPLRGDARPGAPPEPRARQQGRHRPDADRGDLRADRRAAPVVHRGGGRRRAGAAPRRLGPDRPAGLRGRRQRLLPDRCRRRRGRAAAPPRRQRHHARPAPAHRRGPV